jgi:UDP-N-acetylglucosamine:LPS N-acetylglucosamine transferase
LDLFLVTSPAAAAAVRRHAPRMPTAIVPPPVRAAFYEVPSPTLARATLGLATDGACVLVMGGGWGLGPMAETAEALADRGVTVLAVAGHNQRLGRSLAAIGRRQPRVIAYDFTNQIPLLMAAADLVLTTPGATTCSEARVVGRPLMLLDVMPGHGRDNIQHELEMGYADVCDPDPARLVDCVLDALRRTRPTRAQPPGPDRFADTFAEALAHAGIVPGHSGPIRGPSRPVVITPQEVH